MLSLCPLFAKSSNVTWTVDVRGRLQQFYAEPLTSCIFCLCEPNQNDATLDKFTKDSPYPVISLILLFM